VTITSALSNVAQECVGIDNSLTPYMQLAVAYLVIGGQTYFIPQGGWVAPTGALGSTIVGTMQCCYLDPCLGQMMCPTPGGTEPCICLAARQFSFTFGQCMDSAVICQ
jgi:hypothetical protein